MKLLILGSSGVIGKSLTTYLRDKDYECIEWDIKNSIDQDLRKENNLENIITYIDIIIFLAFDVGGSKYQINNIDYINNNVDILRNTFNTVYRHKKKIIYISSQM